MATFAGPSHRHRCAGHSVEHQPRLDDSARLDGGGLVGKTGEWLIHPDDREKSFGELVSLRPHKPGEHFENRIRCKDGSYRWLSWRSISDRSFRYAIARDITNLKQTQEQLHNLRSELALSLAKLRSAR